MSCRGQCHCRKAGLTRVNKDAIAAIRFRASMTHANFHPFTDGVCLAKIKSTFEINNIKKRDVTMLHAMWLGEITIRHGQARTQLTHGRWSARLYQSNPLIRRRGEWGNSGPPQKSK